MSLSKIIENKLGEDLSSQKREEYGPIGKVRNGLILHSSLAVDPNCGQPLGLLWEKIWKRERKVSSKQRRKKAKGFERKESYKWVESIKKVPEVGARMARINIFMSRMGIKRKSLNNKQLTC